jgi:hypothetical protein
MSDRTAAARTFEMELDRQFGDALALPDAEAFALRVAHRLDRGWTARQMLIGGLGLAGGLIGASQLLGSGLLSRLGELTTRSDAMVKSGLARIPVARGLADLVAAGSIMDNQVLWMSAALAVLAAGLLITRAIREI